MPFMPFMPFTANAKGWTLNYFPNAASSCLPGFVVGEADGGTFVNGQQGTGPDNVNYATAYTVTYNPNTTRGNSPQSRAAGPLMTSTEVAAPPLHRKIGLNGRPLPDGKPQANTEADAAPEESFIDAFTLGLHHDTSDLYVPVAASDLALQVRRCTTPEVWNQNTGLTPVEMPDRPFGASWTSNLTANVHFVRQTPLVAVALNLDADYAFVTDEDGSTYRFLITVGSNHTETYVPLPGARDQQDSYLNTLTGDGQGHWTFTRKYGTQLSFTNAGINLVLAGDRISPSASYLQEIHSYARVDRVADRTGTALVYSYASAGTLIPNQIAVANRPGQRLLIASNAQGQVQSVTDPLGKVWNYNYEFQSYSTYPDPTYVPTLANVQAPADPADPAGGQRPTTSYGYSKDFLDDTLPGLRWTPHLSCDVSYLQDPLGNAYSLTYQADRSNVVKVGQGYYPTPGQPHYVSQVNLPGGLGVVNFANHSLVAATPDYTGGPNLVFYGHKANYVVDADGNGRLYQFTAPTIQLLQSFKPYLPNQAILDPFRVPHTTLFQGETITPFSGANVTFNEDDPANFSFTVGNGTAALGQESFAFNLLAGLAPASATDLSGNSTTFTYGDAWNFTANYPFLTAANYAFGNYSDPTAQTDAQNQVRTFTYFPAPAPRTYDPRARRLTQGVDELGRTTVYTLDGYGNRTSEKIYEPSGALARWTDFAYANASFPGFLTDRTVHSATGGTNPAWAVDLVTTYQPDSLGRVGVETMAPGSLNLATHYTYDLNNNKKSVQDPRGYPTTFNYDARNHLIEAVYPNTAASPGVNHRLLSYDLAGRLTKETDENGHATLTSYDAMGRRVRAVRDMDGDGAESGGDILTYGVTFDAVGNKVYELDPNGNLSAYSYDALGRVLTKTDPAPFNYVTTYSYNGPNAGGNVFDSSSFHPTSVVDRRGYTTVSNYDSLYRLTSRQVQYGQAPDPVAYATTSYGFDAAGRPTSETDPLGNVTQRAYDALDRLTSTTFALGTTDQASRGAVYTHTGLAWQQTDENGRLTETRSDAAGRAQFVLQPPVDDGTGTNTQRQPTTQSVYDADGNLAARVDARGNRWDYTYDERDRRTRELGPAALDAQNAPAGPAVRPETDMAYDRAGNVAAHTDPRRLTTVFAYDAANRQTRATAPAVGVAQPDGTTATVSPTTATSYYPNGAVERVTDANGHATVNALDARDQVVSTTDAQRTTVRYDYDAEGNRVVVEDGLEQPAFFRFDGLRRLVQATDATGASTLFGYDGVNKTRRTDALGVVTKYGYDHRNRLTSLTYPSLSSDNRAYAYDGVGNLLGVSQPSQ